MEASARPLSFKSDILPLFRAIDIEHMQAMGVLLDDYDYMSQAENAQQVYDFLTGDQEPKMPPDGPYWSDEQLKLFARWMQEGRKP